MDDAIHFINENVEAQRVNKLAYTATKWQSWYLGVDSGLQSPFSFFPIDF